MFCFVFTSLWCRSLARISIISWSLPFLKKTPITEFMEGKKRGSGQGCGERWQVERRCQGWLLFNKLPLRGWRVPGFWTNLAQFCGAVKFVTHAGQLIPAALSLRPLPVLSSSRVWQQFTLTSLLSFSEAIPQSRDAVLTNSAIQQPPRCAKPFTEHTEEAFHEGTVASRPRNTPE